MDEPPMMMEDTTASFPSPTATDALAALLTATLDVPVLATAADTVAGWLTDAVAVAGADTLTLFCAGTPIDTDGGCGVEADACSSVI